MMEAFLAVFFFLLGLEIGSFLNICIDRLPEGKSVVSPPSHCEACGHRLGAKDLVPLFSYLWLRGKCRYCGAGIPRKLFYVELASGVMCALLFWRYGLSPEFGTMIFYAALFTVVFVVDLERNIVLNKVVYPGMVIAFILSALQLQPELPQWPVGGGALNMVNAVMGGGIGFLFFFAIAAVSHELGWGDVKLAGLIGLAVGFPMVMFAIFLGAFLGAVPGLALIAAGKKGRKSPIPFGPFLSAATMITLVWGSGIIKWYMGVVAG